MKPMDVIWVIWTKLEHVLDFFMKRRVLILYLLVIAGLTAASIYSMVSVVSDYLNNNIMTNVSVRQAPNVLPFLHNVRVYYLMADKPIFPETWAMNQSDLTDLLPLRSLTGNDFRVMKRVATHKTEESFYGHNAATGPLPVDSLLDISIINGIIYKIDNVFVSSMYTQTHVNFTKEVSLDPGLVAPDWLWPDLLSVADEFVEKKYGIGLINQALSRIVKSYANFSSTHYEFEGDSLYYRRLTVSILLNESMVKDDAIQFSILPLMYNGEAVPELGPVVLLLGTETAELFSPDLTIFHLNNPNLGHNKSLSLTVSVQNNGVFRTEKTRSDEACAMCGNLFSVGECMKKCFVSSIADTCKCLPFTSRYVVQYDNKRNTLPYCTTKLYNECLGSKTFQESDCSFNKSQPCVWVPNSIDQTSTLAQEADEQNEYKLNLIVRSNSVTYTVFQEDYQNSCWQMLGQLGGNVGVLTSFSLLGVWQFTLWAFRLSMIRWRKRRSYDTSYSFVLSWFRLAQLNMDIDTLGGKRIDNEQDQANKRIKILESELKKAQAEIDKLKNNGQHEAEKRYNALERRLAALEEVRSMKAKELHL